MDSNKRLVQMTINLFGHWQLSSTDQMALLGGLDPVDLAEGLAESQDLHTRVGHLLGIHKSLRLIFPHNLNLAYLWVAQPNRRFGNTPPLEIMKKGHVGLVAVRRYLDFERER
jgi:hypothetical protein